MKTVQMVNKSRGTVLGSRIHVAAGWRERLRGYLGRPGPEPGEGLLLAPCRAVHTFGLGRPLDVVFLDRAGAVVAVYSALRPGRRTAWERQAMYAVELPPGSIEATGTRTGDRVAWRPEPHEPGRDRPAPALSGERSRAEPARR